jgi:hypothetical protein
MNNYEQKRQLRIERLERAAELCRRASEQAHESAHQMADIIPFGQPILIGHHSEGRDRRYRAKIQRRFEKSFELQEKAKQYTQRAASARANNTISADNPEAIDLLKQKLIKLEEFQNNSKELNRIVKRKAGTVEEKTKEILTRFPNLKPETVSKLFEKDFAGRIGIPDYALTNNNAKMRQVRQRIEVLERAKTRTTAEKMFGDVRVLQNVEENRIQIFFPGKPDFSMRDKLKSNGFHWSPSNGCWQRQLTNSAVYAVKLILLAY